MNKFEQTSAPESKPEKTAIEKEGVQRVEQFTKWLEGSDLLDEKDKGKELEDVSLGKYYEKHLDAFEKDLVNSALGLPDNRSEALKEQIIEADSILHEAIKRIKRATLPEEKNQKLEELEGLRKAVRDKFSRNEFKV